jgi:sialate O-acetylesterase
MQQNDDPKKRPLLTAEQLRALHRRPERTQDANSNRPEVREAQAQAQALKVPNSAMASRDLSDRLARIARANVYGEKIEYSGPMYDSIQVEGQSIRVKFTHIGGGLIARGGDLKWFQIAGVDQTFVDAAAKIDGNTPL